MIVFIAVVSGFLSGAVSSAVLFGKYYLNTGFQDVFSQTEIAEEYTPQTSQEEKIINVVESSSPAVVSVVATKVVPIYEQQLEFTPFGPSVKQRQNGTEKQELGQGSGFIVSEDGLVLTNKHVVADEDADYTIFTNNGKKYSAQVLARDPVQDLAVLRIDRSNKLDKDGNLETDKFPVLKLGDSKSLEIGQTVVIIGNALGEFRNTVSVGVISGLGRRITASDSSGSFVETLENVIQTDAAINQGNSGGPLLNLKGEVVGISTAVVSGAQSIGFAIPSDKAKRAVEQAAETGKIIYPFLGIRYMLVTESLKDQKGLSVDYGALIGAGSQGERAVEAGSAAEKAGIKEGDILLEFGGKKITVDNSLSELILDYEPGETVDVKLLRGGEEKVLSVTLGSREK